MADIKRIGVLTGGGDAPGLNAVIRAVVKAAFSSGIEVLGIEDSFDGLIEPGRSRVLRPADVTGILRLGGTILGTKNSGNPLAYPFPTPEGDVDYSARVIENFHLLGLGAMIVIGGDGTLAIAHEFSKKGIPVVGVPKTIDNDLFGTVNCFGFDTAVDFATDAIDRLHTTAEAHHRVMVVEVMGRYAGWIALHAGVAGGADVILIPEIPFDLNNVAVRLKERELWGARFSIVVVAEGAAPIGGKVSVIAEGDPATAERLGGLSARVAHDLGKLTNKETRYVVLGHLQRGGTPTSFDRVLATRFGGKAIECVVQGDFDKMVALRSPDIVTVPLAEIVGKQRRVPLDSDVIRTARALGISFGDHAPDGN
ncbi:MAG: 6-phosphofructokinase [Vicinamibacterales bacterium]|nr:6-phosphofructokinase [Vicinamibacterales bacterium]